MKHFFPIIFVVLIALSCSDEEDFFFNEPTIDVQFFNIDSLVKVNDSITVVEDSILFLTDSISIWSDSILVLNDTITKLLVLINNGQVELENNKNLLDGYLGTLNSNVTIYTQLDSILDVNNAILKGVKSNIESGKMLLSSLQNTVNGNLVVYEDSATTYFLPLSMTTDITSLQLKIDERNYNLEFGYQRTKEVNEKSRVIVTAFNVSVTQHSFDSAKLICKTSLCENESTSLQIYF